MLTIDFLHAGSGDSIFITYCTDNIKWRCLIDGGETSTAEILRKKIIAGGSSHVELVIVSHIDHDHIGGMIKLLRIMPELTWDDFWFNSLDCTSIEEEFLSFREANELAQLLKDRQQPWNSSFTSRIVHVNDPVAEVTHPLKNAHIHLLSPYMQDLELLSQRWGADNDARLTTDTDVYTDDSCMLSENSDPEELAREIFPEECSVANGSSIALLLQIHGRNYIFSGDAHSRTVERSVSSIIKSQMKDFLAVDLWKVSHHGANRSTTTQLISKIECKNYVISTSAVKYNHPHRALLSKLICKSNNQKRLIFNYDNEKTRFWENVDWMDRFQYSILFGSSDSYGVHLTFPEVDNQ